jgi:hypothetical protein
VEVSLRSGGFGNSSGQIFAASNLGGTITVRTFDATGTPADRAFSILVFDLT